MPIFFRKFFSNRLIINSMVSPDPKMRSTSPIACSGQSRISLLEHTKSRPMPCNKVATFLSSLLGIFAIRSNTSSGFNTYRLCQSHINDAHSVILIYSKDSITDAWAQTCRLKLKSCDVTQHLGRIILNCIH